MVDAALTGSFSSHLIFCKLVRLKKHTACLPGEVIANSTPLTVLTMNKVAALQRKKRKDFIPYFLGFVLFLYCSVHLVSFAAESAEGTHSARVRRALGETWSVCVFVCGVLNLMKVLSRFVLLL